MTESKKPPKRRQIPARDLSAQELTWIREIIDASKIWSNADLGTTRVVAECDCGECRTIYLDSPLPQNPALLGTRGYIGRIEIRTDNEFGITVTLDQLDGKLSELYVDALDLSDERTRPFPEQWEEFAHIVEAM